MLDKTAEHSERFQWLRLLLHIKQRSTDDNESHFDSDYCIGQTAICIWPMKVSTDSLRFHVFSIGLARRASERTKRSLATHLISELKNFSSMSKKRQTTRKRFQKEKHSIHYVQLQIDRHWPNPQHYLSHLQVKNDKEHALTLNIDHTLNSRWIESQRPQLIVQCQNEHQQHIQTNFVHRVIISRREQGSIESAVPLLLLRSNDIMLDTSLGLINPTRQSNSYERLFFIRVKWPSVSSISSNRFTAMNAISTNLVWIESKQNFKARSKDYKFSFVIENWTNFKVKSTFSLQCSKKIFCSSSFVLNVINDNVTIPSFNIWIASEPMGNLKFILFAQVCARSVLRWQTYINVECVSSALRSVSTL